MKELRNATFGSNALKQEVIYKKPVVTRRPPQTEARKAPAPAASNRRAVSVKRALTNITCLVATLSLCFILLANNALLTQKARVIDDKKAALSRLSDKIVQNQMALESKIDLKTVEQIAREKLGMRRAEKFQTVYINSAEGDRGEVVAPPKQTFFARLGFIR